MSIRARDRRRMVGGVFAPEPGHTETVHADLRLAVAHKATFTSITFDECPMQQGGYVGASFEDCTFVRCDLSGCQMTACTFRNCSFLACNMDLVNFGSSIFEGCTFEGGRAEYASFFETAVSHTTFNLQMHGADLRFVFVDSIDMGDSNLWGATFNASCRQFKNVMFSRRQIATFLGLLARTATDAPTREALASILTERELAITDKLMDE